MTPFQDHTHYPKPMFIKQRIDAPFISAGELKKRKLPDSAFLV